MDIVCTGITARKPRTHARTLHECLFVHCSFTLSLWIKCGTHQMRFALNDINAFDRRFFVYLAAGRDRVWEVREREEFYRKFTWTSKISLKCYTNYRNWTAFRPTSSIVKLFNTKHTHTQKYIHFIVNQLWQIGFDEHFKVQKMPEYYVLKNNQRLSSVNGNVSTFTRSNTQTCSRYTCTYPHRRPPKIEWKI